MASTSNLRATAGSATAVGADLGGTKLLVGVVDSDQQVRHRGQEPSHGRTTDEVLDLLTEEIEEAMAAVPGASAVGIGIPATIDHGRGVAINSVNLPIANIPVRDVMRERLNLPVFIDNDANTAALAEFLFGAGRGTQNMVMLTIGTGIGGGLVLGGRLYRGTHGAGAELGHVVIDENGPPCQGTCPNHGCVEALASGTAIGKAGRAAGEREPDSALGVALANGETVDGRTVTETALAGDQVSIAVLDEIGHHLGVALSSFANVFDPDVIVIGGGASVAGDLLLDPAREELRSRALPPMNRTPVVLATAGPDAGMIGAAAMAMAELEAATPS
jgi:glucokinase